MAAEPPAIDTSTNASPLDAADGSARSVALRTDGSAPLASGNRPLLPLERADGGGLLATGRPSPAPADSPVVDEPIYLPGARPRPQGSAVDASHDDEIVAGWNHGGLGPDPTNGSKAKPPHAAPRVKVDVTEVRGDASEADLQRAARLKSYWPFRICYEQGLRRTQKLHGTIKLRLTIGANGRPNGVQQLATELGDSAVVSCVIKSAMGLGLPAPSSGTPQVTLDISLWPGDEPVSVKTSPRGKNAMPTDAAAIADSLRTHLSAVRTCYAAGLSRHDGLWGRLALELRITAGTIADVSEIESHFPDPEVTECVRKAFLHAETPSTHGEQIIVYPLRLGHASDPSNARH